MILDDILEAKQQEVEQLKKTFNKDLKRTLPLVSFIDQFKQQPFQIIAEFKRASPSKGLINGISDPAEQALTYEAYGAGMISVLTDEPFFQGTFDDLVKVKEAVKRPVLNKDFIIDEIQIKRAYQMGADVVLLIISALTQERFRALYDFSVSLGLEVLVEVHDEAELAIALAKESPLIGINNRNLHTFETDLNQTERLMPMVSHKPPYIISESGIQTPQDVSRLKNAGVSGILVGETLMRGEPKERLESFLGTEDAD